MDNKIRVAYFVHDLSDAAVRRRTQMLTECGLEVKLFGFRRSATSVREVDGIKTFDLGRTYNGKLIGRMLSVLAGSLKLTLSTSEISTCDLIIARNMEMLAIALYVKFICGIQIKVIYEVLDIHRVFFSGRAISRIFILFEATLLRGVQSIITSSPAFIDNHFNRYGEKRPGIILVENKVLLSEATFYAGEGSVEEMRQAVVGSKRRWSIAWIGILRCRETLDVLLSMSEALSDRVVVNIYGKPALDEIPDFFKKISSKDNLVYHGPYDRKRDLASIYQMADYVWAADFYDDGFNSDWLLPNRLYEGSLFGAIPIARAGTEVARWLASNDYGVVVGNPMLGGLINFFSNLSSSDYEFSRYKLNKVPIERFVTGPDEYASLCSALGVPYR